MFQCPFSSISVLKSDSSLKTRSLPEALCGPPSLCDLYAVDVLGVFYKVVPCICQGPLAQGRGPNECLASIDLTRTCAEPWKTQQWPQDWKRSVLIPIPKKGNAKECSNYCTIALISHTSKVMLKILQARLQKYVSG